MGIYAMRELGVLKPDAQAIGVGSGVELIQFILTNYVAGVTGTDLYRPDIHYRGVTFHTPCMHSAQIRHVIELPGIHLPDILEDPKKCLVHPIPWKPERFKAVRVDGTTLEGIETNSMDFAFSFSSIEHFQPTRVPGSAAHIGAMSAMRAVSRVLKPGGHFFLSTEWSISDREDNEFFRRVDIENELLKCSPLKPVCPIDWDIEPHLYQPENWNKTHYRILIAYHQWYTKVISKEAYEDVVKELVRDVGHNVIAQVPKTETDEGIPHGSIFLTFVNDK